MGLFSRKKTVLSATTASMVTDSPDIVQQSVLTSIALGTDITTDLVANLQAGVAANMQRYYSAGKYRKEQGLCDLFPTSHNTLFSTRVIDIEYALNDIHGEPTHVINYSYQPLDTDMMAYEYMQEHYGYSTVDKSFTSSPSGYPASELLFDSTYLTSGRLYIRYGNTNNDDLYIEETDVTGLVTSDVYYHVLYVLTRESNEYLYWNYRVASNDYPFLGQNEFKYDEGYFPVVPIIEYSKNMTHEDLKETAQYSASKILLSTVGLDFVDIHDSLAESESYDTIEQAHFACAVRLRDDDPFALKYMFNFFKSIYGSQHYSEAAFKEWGELDNAHVAPPMNSLNYRMTAFKIDFKWSYIKSTLIDKAWPHGSEQYKRFHVVKGKEEIVYTSESGEKIETGQYYDESTITFLRKIDDASYEELTIVGASQINYIDNSYSIEWDVAAMFDDSAEGQDPVSFLVQPDIVRSAFPSLVERNTFYYRTYTLVLNFKEVVKLKWYQTGFFQFVMIAVAIVITVWSMGTLAEGIVAAYGVAGGGAAGLAAATGQALIYAGLSAATNWVLTELMTHYGWEIGAIIGVVLVAFVGYSDTVQGFMPDGFTIGKFTADIMKSFEDFFKESAEDLMAQATKDLEDYKEWESGYEEMYDDLFGLGDSFAEIYAQYTEDKSVYNSLAADEFMFVAMDMMLMSPTIVTSSTENYIDNTLNVETRSL